MTRSWTPVCRLDDIARLGSRRITRATGAPVALFRTPDDRVHALLDRCPHKGGPLSEGMVLADAVVCPLHNWTIAFADGRAAAPDEGATPRFAVSVVDGVVRLDADELDQLGLGDASGAAAAGAGCGCGAGGCGTRNPTPGAVA